MKRFVVAITVFSLVLGMSGCGSKEEDNTSKDAGSKAEEKTVEKSGVLNAPTIEADGKELALPCTLQELLDFGFEVRALPESVTSINQKLKDYVGEGSVDLTFSDGTLYNVTVKGQDFKEETPFNEFVVSSFRDENPIVGNGPKPEELLKESKLTINGVTRSSSEKDIDKILGDYDKTSYDKQISYRNEAEDEEPFEVNGYLVDYVSMTIDNWGEEGAYLMCRTLSLENPTLPDED